MWKHSIVSALTLHPSRESPLWDRGTRWPLCPWFVVPVGPGGGCVLSTCIPEMKRAVVAVPCSARVRLRCRNGHGM